MRHALAVVVALLAALAFQTPVHAAASPAGRWDATITWRDRQLPAWFELRQAPNGDWLMDWVGNAGPVATLKSVMLSDRTLVFTTPDDVTLRGEWHGNFFRGTAQGHDGLTWSAARQPAERARHKGLAWGESVALLDGQSLAGWRSRWNHEHALPGWSVIGGALVAEGRNNDLVSTRSYGDFRLQLEYLLEEGADSGVHLRGRYEIQLTTDDGDRENTGKTGGIYSRIAPAAAPQHRAGEWNTLDATLIGRHVTVAINGVTTVDNGEIAGITGDALDSAEGRAGPIMLQGHLGRVRYRNITVSAAR